MRWVFGGLVLAFVVALAVGAITGRVRARSCCTPGDPGDDARMQGARGGRSAPSDVPR